MTKIPRISFLLVALSLVAFASACNQDEPATYLPKSGDWTYQQTTVVSNSCNADLTPDPLTTFLLDYDDGDSFQIELGEDDVTCEIDGTAFTCGNYVYSVESPDIAVVLTWTRTWEGEFSSETEAEGEETTRVTCAGDDCNLIANIVPCSVKWSFDASAI